MKAEVGDIVEMKKEHPCGNKSFLVLRNGLDYKLQCIKCEHTVMAPRLKIEKFIKKIINKNAEAKNDRQAT